MIVAETGWRQCPRLSSPVISALLAQEKWQSQRERERETFFLAGEKPFEEIKHGETVRFSIIGEKGIGKHNNSWINRTSGSAGMSYD